MRATLYLIRHCAATGQEPDAPLTPEGVAQAEWLADSLMGAGIKRIASSPYTRALASIQPLATRLHLPIRPDDRLRERVLGDPAPRQWRDALKATFDDAGLRYPGGESSRMATARAVAALNDARSGDGTAVVVSHGNVLTLLLRHLDPRYGFDQWLAMTNPDVYAVTVEYEGVSIDRLGPW